MRQWRPKALTLEQRTYAEVVGFRGHALDTLHLRELPQTALDQKLFELSCRIYETSYAKDTHEVTFTYSHPDGWWQAFRAQYFPSWWLRRWPVRMHTEVQTKTVEADYRARFPDLPASPPGMGRVSAYINWKELP